MGKLYYFLRWVICACYCLNCTNMMSFLSLSCNGFIRSKGIGKGEWHRLLLKCSLWIFLVFMELLSLSQGNWYLRVRFIFVANEQFSLRLYNCFLILS